MNKVVVYGTLRRGHHNHHMMKGANYLGKVAIPKGYKKVVKGLPYLIEDPTGEGCDAELYEVSDLLLRLLDRFEGSPDWYCRKQIKISLDNGETTVAWCYLMPKERM